MPMPRLLVARTRSSSSAPSPASPARTSHRNPEGKDGGSAGPSKGTVQPPEPFGESCIDDRAAKTEPWLWFDGNVASGRPGPNDGPNCVAPCKGMTSSSSSMASSTVVCLKTRAYSSALGRPTKELRSVTERNEFRSVKEFRSVNEGRISKDDRPKFDSNDGRLNSSGWELLCRKAASTASTELVDGRETSLLARS